MNREKIRRALEQATHSIKALPDSELYPDEAAARALVLLDIEDAINELDDAEVDAFLASASRADIAELREAVL